MGKPSKAILEKIIAAAIAEDIGDGDHTSLACIPQNANGKAQLLVKENGIIAGVELAMIVFSQVDSSLEITTHISDGSKVKKGDIVFVVSGSVRSILQAERIALNFMQRMSGIATITNQIAETLKSTNTKVLDTRKTTPGLRAIEKWAVAIGGGTNHRFGLYDMVMIKDNHIDYSGGIKEAIQKTQQYLSQKNKSLKVEIEARNLKEVEEILSIGGVDRIMLDNFSYEDTVKAVALIRKKTETESSGNITIETARKYAGCGVDYVSIGALTHSVKSLDLSLKAVH